MDRAVFSAGATLVDLGGIWGRPLLYYYPKVCIFYFNIPMDDPKFAGNADNFRYSKTPGALRLPTSFKRHNILY
jgi:hypothetical protein